MPEMYKPMKFLEGMALSNDCALITDGRFSGSNRGLFVGHISPEAADGGVIGLIKDGDQIKINISERTLSLLVDEAEIQNRYTEWKPLTKQVPSGFLNLYRERAASAVRGSITMNKVYLPEELAGVNPIAAMPFTVDGHVDLVSFTNMINHLVNTGCNGITLFGIASEFYKLTERERATC
ncbi:dihydroxy-acid dehydratase [Vibrio taketomensis]|uniref:dihydroxy-acid dehydratase domain-containing protein n=1 Tax=Vibrio taketomensis TaxID=2572923 RepID=UPI0022B29609|nr:dihydroxy-acid dehydratase [Vibrio taketomensis]